MLIHGVDYDDDSMSAAQEFHHAFRLHSEDAMLKRSAHDAVITPDELRVCVAASRRDSAAFGPVTEAKMAQNNEENRDKMQAARAKRQEIIDRGPAEAQRRRQEAEEAARNQVQGQEDDLRTID